MGLVELEPTTKGLTNLVVTTIEFRILAPFRYKLVQVINILFLRNYSFLQAIFIRASAIVPGRTSLDCSSAENLCEIKCLLSIEYS